MPARGYESSSGQLDYRVEHEKAGTLTWYFTGVYIINMKYFIY